MEEAKIKSNILFDPQRDTYDSALWKTLTGAPAIGSNLLVFNAGSAIQKRDIERVNSVAFGMRIPAAPTAGDVRFFGLKSLNLGAYVGIDITDDVCSIVCADGYGLTDSNVITWRSTWTNAFVKWEFNWLPGRINVYADGVYVGWVDATKAPKSPLSVYINNANADAMDLKYLILKDVAEYSAGIQATVNVTADTEFPTATVMADNDANPTTTRVGANLLGYDGSTWDRIRAGLTSITSSLAGWINVLPYGLFHTTPTTRTNNQGGPLEVDSLGNLRTVMQNTLVKGQYDYISDSWNAGTFTETFVYKTGGSGGTTVATVTVVYTDATKDQLVSVTVS